MKTALQRLPLLGIVIVATGCDNVEWEGVELGWRLPSDSVVSAPAPEVVEVAESPVPEESPLGPILYLGHRDGSEATLVAVAEVRPEGLFPLDEAGSAAASRSFTSENLAPGMEFTLFSDGARVGRLTAERFSVDQQYCGARPRILGPIELTPSAATVQKFLALSTSGGRTFPHGAYSPVLQTRALRESSLRAMQEIIPAVGATWPGPVLGIRRDVQVFQARPGAPPTVVATFVYEDDLVVGPAPGRAYSVFLTVDDDEGSGYSGSYAEYRVVSRDGKAAARYFDHLDVDGDGTDEIVLEVLGEDSMWLSTLGRRGDNWAEEYRDSCGLPPRSSEPTR